MSGSVNRVTRMRPVAALPFSDSFTRSDGPAEDTTHPWYAPVSSQGGRLDVVSNKLAVSSGIANCKGTLLLPSTDVDVQFDFTHSAGTVPGSSGDMQVRMFLYDPTLRADTPVDYYLFATSLAIDGWTLSHVHNGSLSTVMTVGSAFTRGSTYTIRLRMLASGFFRVYVGGVLKVQEAPYFTPASGQTAIEFLADDTTINFDTLTIATSVMSSPGVDGVITDNFNRANGALTTTPTGETYTLVQSGGTHPAQVISNQLALSSGRTSSDTCRVFLDLTSTTQTFRIDAPTLGAYADGVVYLTIWLRYTSATDCDFIQWSRSGSNWSGAIYKAAGGTTSLTSSANFTTATPTRIQASISASGAIRATFTTGSGDFLMTASDNTRTGTKAGTEVIGASVFDNLVTSTP